MKNLPKIVNKKHKLESGNPVPDEMMNEWGHPSSEHLVFVGCTTIRNKQTRVDEETEEKTDVLIVSHISTWNKVNPNEKTATQLKKEKAQLKTNTPKPKKPTKQDLKDECKSNGLKVGGNMSQLQSRLDTFYAQCGAGERSDDWKRKIEETMRSASLPTTDGIYQCCSCEAFFNTPTDDDQCPHCFSGNWIEGAIDDPAKEESE